MTTLLLNAFLMLVVILFGAMAYYPLFLKSSDTEDAAESYGEDIVVSVVPAPLETNAPRPIVLPRPDDHDHDSEHPGHIPAA